MSEGEEKIHLIHYRNSEPSGGDETLGASEANAKKVGFETYTNVDSLGELIEAIKILLVEDNNPKMALVLWFKVDDICKHVSSFNPIQELFRDLEEKLKQFSREKITILLDTWGLEYPHFF